MASAVCRKCNRVVPWHAGRGTRLSGLRCPECGGELRAIHGHEWEYLKGNKLVLRPVG
jgi:DNA-directed RNA polymerase subunit RPC12/RpoP